MIDDRVPRSIVVHAVGHLRRLSLMHFRGVTIFSDMKHRPSRASVLRIIDATWIKVDANISYYSSFLFSSCMFVQPTLCNCSNNVLNRSLLF